MGRTVTLPLWLFLLIGGLAAWSLLTLLLLPSARWWLRRRVNRAIGRLNERLHIQLQPFKLTKRQVLIDRLAYDPRVLEAVEEHARTSGVPREVALESAGRYAREIVPAFNAVAYFSAGYWVARRIARLLYRVRIGWLLPQGLADLGTGQRTVVFVMNHRSNMDYVLVSYLIASRTALSFAVGEWARVWPLRSLVRMMGAYFVRRRSRNVLYRRVLERYVQMSTASGVTQALFPEGGLSRDGSLCQPKLGILDYIVRDFDPAGERDVLFVPVGINYDRVFEDRTLLRELEPGAQRVGRLRAAWVTTRFVLHNLVLMLRQRWYRFGYACVYFGQPVSLAAHLFAHRIDPRVVDAERRRPVTQSLASRLMSEIGRVVPVLPVPLVASVFARHPERSFGELELLARVHALAEELETLGAQVYVPRKDRAYAMHAGLRLLVLRRLVREEQGLLRAVPEELPLLRYYARSIAHWGAGGPLGGGRKEPVWTGPARA